MFLRGMPRAVAPVVMTAVLAACDLTEVTTEPGDDVVVVEAVLRTDFPRQQVLLHRTLQGRLAGSVTGATVVITDPAGREHRLTEGFFCFRIDPTYARTDPLDFQGTCYSEPDTSNWVRPGATYELRVETPRGEVIRGRTRVPGEFLVRSVPVATRVERVRACTIAPDSTMTLRWTHSDGAASYVADLQVHGLSGAFLNRGINVAEPLELRGLSVSAADTTVVLPTEFGVFERLDYETELLTAIAHGFPEGVTMELQISAADLNWVNSVRGGNFNPSGLIRISTVVGDGVGVFGSLNAKRAAIIVRKTASPVRCAGAGGPISSTRRRERSGLVPDPGRL